MTGDKESSLEWHPLAGAELTMRVSEYQRLRQSCPVPLAHDLQSGRRFWSVLRYSDIGRIVRDPMTYSNSALRRLGTRRPPLETDPPDHGVIRKLLQPFVLPKAIQSAEESTRLLCAVLLAPLIARGTADLAQELARPLPVQVLMRWLGQPPADWEPIKGWSDSALPRTFIDQEDEQCFRRSDEQLWNYSLGMVKDRCQRPREAHLDPASALLSAGVSTEDTVGVMRLLLSAGHDSTSLALGICIHYLATDPATQDELRAQPSLVRGAIEEILRLETPVVAMPRQVTRDVAIGDSRLAAGDRVLLNWASANRDPEVFPNSDVCDFQRRPNPHLVFGLGIHSCLGAPLARQELRICLEELLMRTERFELAGEPAMFRMYHYGFERLPIRLQACHLGRNSSEV
jgi:cytochrome P450